jgi:hypothetical protein
VYVEFEGTHVWRQQEVIKDFSGTGLTGHTCELVDGNKLIIYGGETGVIVRDNVACIETGACMYACAVVRACVRACVR